METTAEIAGFFAAHAVWCVMDGETLTPLVAFEKEDGTRQMYRFVTDRVEEGRSVTDSRVKPIRAAMACTL